MGKNNSRNKTEIELLNDALQYWRGFNDALEWLVKLDNDDIDDEDYFYELDNKRFDSIEKIKDLRARLKKVSRRNPKTYRRKRKNNGNNNK